MLRNHSPSSHTTDRHKNSYMLLPDPDQVCATASWWHSSLAVVLRKPRFSKTRMLQASIFQTAQLLSLVRDAHVWPSPYGPTASCCHSTVLVSNKSAIMNATTTQRLQLQLATLNTLAQTSLFKTFLKNLYTNTSSPFLPKISHFNTERGRLFHITDKHWKR